MYETGTLFDDDLLLEQDQRASLAIPVLPGTLISGVDEAARALGVEGLTAAQRATRGFMALLTSRPDGRKQQKSYHIGQLDDVIAAVEKSRAVDTYIGNAIFASARSRRAANVRSLQVAWVDLDCYKLGLCPTPELVERLVERARFAGIPAPTHIISSGRGLYLKWLLDAPVADSDLHTWRLLQKGLNALFMDVGSDLAAIDQARVLRVVGSINSKVHTDGARDDASRVGVVWDSCRRHRFSELCMLVAQLDLPDALQSAPVARTDRVLHQIRDAAGKLILPVQLQGDLQQLAKYGESRRPDLELEARARAAGKNGMSAVTLGWHRFLDLRDLMTMRAEATGGHGIAEGARDLTMLYMVNFLAQARMVRSSTLFQEVAELLPAFDGVGAAGPQGYESPANSGALNTLAKKMQASERGIRVRFGGSLWDPKYTPSNDYLINLFSITSSEMSRLRTIIDSGEKRTRADKKVIGRGARREVRQAWHTKALTIREENHQKAAAGEPSIPPRQLAAHIASSVGATPQMVRNFLRVHDQAAQRAVARARGEAPPRAYRRLGELSAEEQRKALAQRQRAAQRRWLSELRAQGYEGTDDPAAVQGWLDARARTAEIELERQRAEAMAEQQTQVAVHQKRLAAALERIAARAAAQPASLSTNAEPTHLATSAPLAQNSEGAPVGEAQETNDAGWSHAGVLTENILRRIGVLRDDRSRTGPATHMPTPHMTADTPALRAAQFAAPRASKRELFNRARLAAGRPPLMAAGANDESISSPSAVPTSECEGGAPRSAIARAVIPPDFDMDAVHGQLDDGDGEPAGMPDLDDGYLDSFGAAPGRSHQTPASAAALDAGAARATSAPAPVPPAAAVQARRFTAAPQARTPGAALRPGLGLSGFPVNPAAEAPRGSVRSAFGPAPGRPALAADSAAGRDHAGAPLAFKRAEVATLSPEQARINGQNVDFAKLFDEPRYDAAGVQVGYPSHEVWPDDGVPAGSQFSREEWEAARQSDPDLEHGHIVVEMQVGNPIAGALLKIPRVIAASQASGPSAPSSPGRGTRAVNGKVVQPSRWEGIDDVMADALADTIVVSRKCPVAPEWRGAVEGGIEHVRGGVSSFFRIIRPRAHYSDPNKMLYINAKLQITGSFADRGATFADRDVAQPHQGEALAADDDTSGTGTPRG